MVEHLPSKPNKHEGLSFNPSTIKKKKKKTEKKFTEVENKRW
jgi:hypothetical protein